LIDYFIITQPKGGERKLEEVSVASSPVESKKRKSEEIQISVDSSERIGDENTSKRQKMMSSSEDAAPASVAAPEVPTDAAPVEKSKISEDGVIMLDDDFMALLEVRQYSTRTHSHLTCSIIIVLSTVVA